MVTLSLEEEAVQLVKDYWLTASVKGARIIDRVPDFLGGALYVVEITDAVDRDHENFVLLKDGKLRRFDTLRELAATVPKLSTRERLLEPSFIVPVVTGVIALVIVLTICYLAISDPKSKMPDVLAGALALVLGFYFGATSSRSARDK